MEDKIGKKELQRNTRNTRARKTLKVKEADALQGVNFSFAIFARRMYRLFDEMHHDVNGYLMSLQSVECECQSLLPHKVSAR